jgi:hypothetical protein
MPKPAVVPNNNLADVDPAAGVAVPEQSVATPLTVRSVPAVVVPIKQLPDASTRIFSAPDTLI